jgi:hypothetical protein
MLFTTQLDSWILTFNLEYDYPFQHIANRRTQLERATDVFPFVFQCHIVNIQAICNHFVFGACNIKYFLNFLYKATITFCGAHSDYRMLLFNWWQDLVSNPPCNNNKPASQVQWFSSLHKNVSSLYPIMSLIKNTHRFYEIYSIFLPIYIWLLKWCASIQVEFGV